MDEPDRTYLGQRLAVLTERTRRSVEIRRSEDPDADDPFRGLYIADEAVDRLLEASTREPVPESGMRAEVEAAADAVEALGHELRLRLVARAAVLSHLDVELLVIALAPDVDARFERFYGYLNDDVSRRRASAGLALELAGASPAVAADRARLGPSAPLARHGLLVVEDLDRPLLTRGLRVPDRVTAHLLGDDAPDPKLHAVLSPDDVDGYEPLPDAFVQVAAGLTRAIKSGHRFIHLREKVGGTGGWVAGAVLHAGGLKVVRVDLERLAAADDPRDYAEAVGREATLLGAGVIAGPVDRAAETAPGAMRALIGLPVPLILVGAGGWDPRWSTEVPLFATIPSLQSEDRNRMWEHALGDGATPELTAHVEHIVLGPDQVTRAVVVARGCALLADRPIAAEDLNRGARTQNGSGLERLARRIEPGVGWEDLVLPDTVSRSLRELAARARHRDRVLVGWRMRRGGGRGCGVVGLFAGDSGTGKTMSAEVIAADLGLDLYAVNLATVVDKYIGETEKNLERIFTEAAGVNAVLLFDEADAIFGKRSEVRDAHDRYANVESAYLLQRLESFDGLAILTTNLRSNIDEAFTRRLDMVIDFPAPDETSRLALWQRCLAPPLPCAADLDLEFCARSFVLSGGNIRSAATTAAYLAAAGGGEVGMDAVVAAVQQEYRKLGRLIVASEFGPYLTA